MPAGTNGFAKWLALMLVVPAVLCRTIIAGQTGDTGDVARALAGAVDVHVHSLPDDRPRSIDAVEVATLAAARKMRAIVLKNHYESTAGLVYMVRKAVPGIEVFGGIDLNLTVGGINPAAVEHMTRVTGGWGRIVWMPTFDAENQVRYSKENRPFVSVSAKGDLLPAVKEVIALIARHGLVLATGHSSPAEGLMLLREGRRQGVQRMLVTHAMNAPVLMNVAADAGGGETRRVHRVRRRFAGHGGRAGSNGPLRRRDPQDRAGALHPFVRSWPTGQRAAAGRLRRLPRGYACERAHRTGRRKDVEAESRDAIEPGTLNRAPRAAGHPAPRTENCGRTGHVAPSTQHRRGG